jgi:multidrug transporter EmrE-like cation transporter
MISLKNIEFLYVFGTIFFTVYGQLVLKWRIEKYGSLPENFYGKISFLFSLLSDPFILSGFISAFVASFFWMAAMTKVDLSYAYPFMSLSFILVFLLSVWFFQEPVTMEKILGMVLIVSGVVVTSRSL